MLNKLLKPVRELLEIFRKQNTIAKIIIVVLIVGVSRYIMNTLIWGHFAKTYVENFDLGGTKSGKEIVLCHMNQCGHCKKMMPEWDKFASKSPIKTRKIEVNQDPSFMEKHNVSSFPTILALDSSGKKIDEYDGERNASSLMKYAEKIKGN